MTYDPIDSAPDTPDWAALPPILTSIEAAGLLQVLPKTLSKYVQRGQLAGPVERGANHANYRRDDVRAYWERRQQQRAQRYSRPPAIMPPEAEEEGQAPRHPSDTPLSPAVAQGTVPGAEDGDLVTLTRESLAALLTAAVAEGVRQGSAGLESQMAGLEARIGRLVERLEREEETEPPTAKAPTLWERLTGRR